MKKNIKYTKFRSTSIYFLIMYFIILILPTFAMLGSYSIAKNIINKNTREDVKSTIGHTIQNINNYLLKVENNASIISYDNFLNSILTTNYDSLSGATYYNIAKLTKQLRAYQIIDDSYISLMIYLKNSKIIITEETSYTVDNFYGKYFEYCNVTFDQWYAMFEQVTLSGTFFPAATSIYNKKLKNTLPFYYPITTTSIEPRGYVILLLDEERILSLLQNAIKNNNGYICIRDANGNIITDHNNHPEIDSLLFKEAIDKTNSDEIVEIDDKNMLYTSSASNYNGWQYYCFIPEDYVFRNITSLKQLSIGLIIATIFSGLLLSLYFTRLNMRPIKSLLKSFFQNDSNEQDIKKHIRNEYQLIAQSIEKLQNDKKNLVKKIDLQRPIMQSALFYGLISEHYTNINEIKNVLVYLEIPFDCKFYIIAIMKLIAAEEKENLRNYESNVLIGESLIYKKNEYLYKQYLDKDRMIFLYSCECKNAFEFTTKSNGFLNNNARMINECFAVDAVFGVSSVYSDITQIGHMYKQALDISNIQQQYGKKIIRYSDIKDNKQSYYFPISLELKLHTAIKAADLSTSNEILDYLYNENIKNRVLSYDMKQYFVNNLQYTIQRALHESDNSDLASGLSKKVSQKFDFGSNYFAFYDIIEKSCDVIKNKQYSYQNKLIDEIIDYIEVNFKNDLYLTSIAEKFELSETYLSHIFKKITGENISRFLECKRIEYACNMFAKDSQIHIKDVAREVGYNNELTFRRAFKRHVYLTPSKYIEQLEREGKQN